MTTTNRPVADVMADVLSTMTATVQRAVAADGVNAGLQADKAALTTANQTLTNRNASLADLNQTLATDKAALQATVSTQALAIGSLTGQVADLRAQLAAAGGGTPTPAPTPTPTPSTGAFVPSSYAAPAVSPSGYSPTVDLARQPELSTYLGQSYPENQTTVDLVVADLNAMAPMGAMTCMTIKDGLVGDASIWMNGKMPTSLDDIVHSEHHVQINTSVTFGRWMTTGTGVYHAQPLDGGDDFVVTCETVMGDGHVIVGSYEQPKSAANQHRVRHLFKVNPNWGGPGTTDRLGLMTTGASRIFGAEKAGSLFAMDTIPAGATSVTLPSASTVGWRVGDVLCFESTDDFVRREVDPTAPGPSRYFNFIQDSSQIIERNVHSSQPNYGGALGHATDLSERRTITAINGNVVSWDAGQPLARDHTAHSCTLPSGKVVHLLPLVHNETKSVAFESDSTASLQTRAHLMFMATADHIQSQFQLIGMGRTSNDPTLVVPYGAATAGPNNSPEQIASRMTDPDTGADLADPNNVIGRYAIHWHRTGSNSSTPAAAARDISVTPKTDGEVDPGWAVVAHDSRVNMERIYVRARRGGSFVWEDGRENGQAVDCTAIFCPGDGFDDTTGGRAERLRDMGGHSGVAFLMNSRQINLKRCRAVNAMKAFRYFQQTYFINNFLFPVGSGTGTGYHYAPDLDTLELYDPLTWSNAERNGADDIQQVYERKGLALGSYGFEQSNPAIVEDLYVGGCLIGFSPNHRRFTDRRDNTPYLLRGLWAVGTQRPFNVDAYSFVYGIRDFALFRKDKAYLGADSYNIPTSAGLSFNSPTWQNCASNGYIENFVIGVQSDGSTLNYGGFPFDITVVNVDQPVTYAMQPGPSGIGPVGPYNNPSDSPYKDLMGPWAYPNGPGTYPVLVRPQVIYKSATDFPLNLPKQPFGPAEPAPGTAKPYATSVSQGKVLAKGGALDQLSIGIIVTDAIGSYYYGDNQNLENVLFNYGSTNGQIAGNASPETYLERNKCFKAQDGSWQMAMWFPTWDRANNELFPHLELVAVTGYTDAELAPYQRADANATRPAWADTGRFKLQALRTNAILPDPVPVINTPASVTNKSGLPLAFPLKSRTATARPAITGGADAAKFDVAFVSGGFVLRWVGDGTQSFLPAADADGDHNYQVEVTWTTPRGATAMLPITVTLIQRFAFDLATAGDLSTMFPDILTYSQAGVMTTDGKGTAKFTGTSGPLTRDMGTNNHAITFTVPTDTAKTDIVVSLAAGGADFVRYQRGSNGGCNIYTASTGQSIYGESDGRTKAGDKVTLGVKDGQLIVAVNGVERFHAPLPVQAAVGPYVGFYNFQGLSADPTTGPFEITSL